MSMRLWLRNSSQSVDGSFAFLPPAVYRPAASSRFDGRASLSVPSPQEVTVPMVSTWIRPLALPLEQDETGYKAHSIFHGPTPNLLHLGCHVSVLDPGNSPHEPHLHPEEEVLVVLDGGADLVLVDEESGERVERARPGGLSYYSGQQRHTIRGAGDGPVTYVMFRWRGDPRDKGGLLQSALHIDGSQEAFERLETASQVSGMQTEVVFEGPTRYLQKLHCHVTKLEPGAGYDAHADPYDVGIVALSGTLETLGRRVEAPAVVFYSGGEPHGMRNVGETPAGYVVFEFHREDADAWILDRLVVRRTYWLVRRTVSRVLRRFPRLHRATRNALRR